MELEGGAQAMVEFSSEQIALENYTKYPTLEVCQLSKVVINDMFNIHISLCSHVIFIYLHIYSQGRVSLCPCNEATTATHGSFGKQ